MTILLKFNDSNEYTYKQLLDQTKISEKDLKRCLLSMSMGKQGQRVLLRNGNGKELRKILFLSLFFCLEESDAFTVNDGFTSKLTRIKIQMVSGKTETDAESKHTKDKVADDRKHEIEAAIVRVMKARKTSIHNDLITEVSVLYSRTRL